MKIKDAYQEKNDEILREYHWLLRPWDAWKGESCPLSENMEYITYKTTFKDEDRSWISKRALVVKDEYNITLKHLWGYHVTHVLCKQTNVLCFMRNTTLF